MLNQFNGTATISTRNIMPTNILVDLLEEINSDPCLFLYNDFTAVENIQRALKEEAVCQPKKKSKKTEAFCAKYNLPVFSAKAVAKLSKFAKKYKWTAEKELPLLNELYQEYRELIDVNEFSAAIFHVRVDSFVVSDVDKVLQALITKKLYDKIFLTTRKINDDYIDLGEKAEQFLCLEDDMNKYVDFWRNRSDKTLDDDVDYLPTQYFGVYLKIICFLVKLYSPTA